MLKQTNRLTKRKEFGYVYKHGKYAYNECLTLIYVPSKLKNIRIGFSISKKIGKAVIRNKLKRQLREIVRVQLDNLKPNFNYIFVAKPELATLTYEQIESNVLDVIKKANLLKWKYFLK